MSTAGSCESNEGVHEAGYSVVSSKWIESGASVRSNRYPFKRYPAAGRPNGIGADVLNGLEKEESGVEGNKGGAQLPPRNRALAGRVIKNDGECGSAKGRSCIYSVLISVVLCCFLAEALLQGSVMMLWKQTDISLDFGYARLTESRRLEDPERYSSEYKLRFEPWKLKERLSQRKHRAPAMRMSREGFLRQPRLALLCSNLYNTPESLYLITIVKGLQALGYKIQLFTLQDGPMRIIWETQAITVNLLHPNVDWSNFEGVIVSSLNAKHALSSFMQEPFRGLVVIWIILEDTLGKRVSFYQYAGTSQLILEWKHAFERADVVVFPDYPLAMMHSLFDTGNFYVIPGSPVDLWEIKSYMIAHNRDEVQKKFGLSSQDITLAVVGSPFTYKGVWREHAIVMRAILPVLDKLNQAENENHLSLKLIFISGNSISSYRHVLQEMAHHFGFVNGSVSYFSSDKDINGLLWVADIVIYSSLRDEQSFPSVLLRAMALGRFILAPNITVNQNFIVHGIGGLLYRAGDVDRLTETVALAISKHNTMEGGVPSRALLHAAQLSVSNVLIGYADLLETVLSFPSDVMLPQPISMIPLALRRDWQWDLLIAMNKSYFENASQWAEEAFNMVLLLEKLFNGTENNSMASHVNPKEEYEMLSHADWEEEKAMQRTDDIERKEEEQIEERNDLLRGSWEDVYKVVKKMERVKNELHERDDGELERTGQPICIYEPYFGIGSFPFLHQSNPLYRGISMFSEQKRSGHDDVDAALRLPVLNDSYYREVLCEYGAFFAIANRIDRVHKNAWIGFQPWRASGRKVALSKEAEKSLRDTIRLGTHGDAVYFWSKLPVDNPNNRDNVYQDFWSICDMVNNNQCRSVFLQVFKQMYGLPSNWTLLPPMPADYGNWSVLHCWAMPTSSFLEFVMFSRMFVNALDSQHYTEHHDNGYCCLGISELEVKHCYCRLLELLINVWSYHSARIMIFVDPMTGSMHEQHSLEARQGHMWVKFFDYNALKGMDEDLAEEADDERHGKRWLWPYTGEVFWQGVSERERRKHYFLRLEKKKKNKERLERIRSRYRQKPLAAR